jgi:ArsR family transcriptional regulator
MAGRRLDALERLFKALGDRTRLRILALLATGETCVCDIHEALRIPQPKASRHLAYLRRAGLVEARKDGLWVHYRLAAPADGLTETLLATACHCLTHVPSTGTDRARLERRCGERAGGRSGQERAEVPSFSCCVPAGRRPRAADAVARAAAAR